MQKRIVFISEARSAHQAMLRRLRENGFHVSHYLFDEVERFVASDERPDLIVCERGDRADAVVRRFRQLRRLSSVSINDLAIVGGDAQDEELLTALVANVANAHENELVQQGVLQAKLRMLSEIRSTDPEKLLPSLAGVAQLLSEGSEELTPEQIRRLGQIVLRANNLLANALHGARTLARMLAAPNEEARRKEFRERSSKAPAVAAEAAAGVLAESLQRADDLEIDIEEGQVLMSPQNLVEMVSILLGEPLVRTETGSGVTLRGRREGPSYCFLIESPPFCPRLGDGDEEPAPGFRIAPEVARLHGGSLEADCEKGRIELRLPFAVG